VTRGDIISAAVGRRPEGDSDGEAVMVVTADSQVPANVGHAAGEAAISSRHER
jgi:hypothetical protein